ncbi:MAG: HD domain-containing protein [Treponema sp.]|nr:HD domain-containing protein [Treponema sp.]
MHLITNRIKIPNELQKMNEIFVSHGYQAYLVGGAVRDTIMGNPVSDWDVATNATPQQVMSIFHKVIPTGIAHGTVTVHIMGKEIETTTFRTESDYSDGRHPDSVSYAATIEEDLSRRDFTMNAIAVNLQDGTIVDPYGGQQDIKKKIIRTVGNPIDRFTEDGLRPIRALRFSAQLNFKIEPETFNAIQNPLVREKTKQISIERFRDEFIKMLHATTPSIGLHFMEQTGVLNEFIPEFTPCRNCIQGDNRGFHDFDVMDHCFYACDGAPKNNTTVRLSALFHDIGKPSVKKSIHVDNEIHYTFYNHESESAQMTKDIMRRLKFPNATIEAVCHLVKNHMFFYEPTWSDAAIRRFLVRVKPECIADLFDLRIADVYGMHNQPVRLHDSEVSKNLCELQNRIDTILEKNATLRIKDLAINGEDLMKQGIPSGKILGRILNNLLDTVLDDPAQNTKEKLLLIAQSLYNEYNKNSI